ncbi:hypothetical protein [Streptomyces zaomyceticus]|uniref:hypothetical protein n=1 Tax=Streptomyces zaomyceticus TaxID=68286 RepID=UPI003799CBDF
MKLRAAAAVTAALAFAGVALSGTNAQAATGVPQICSKYSNYLCLFYNSYYEGAYYATQRQTSNFDGEWFDRCGTSCAGLEYPVKNNAASASVGNTGSTARIFFNSNWAGVWDDVAPNSKRQLDKTYNNNASMNWL